MIFALKVPMQNVRQASRDDAAAIKELVSETLLRCVVDNGESYNTLFREIRTLIDAWVESPNDNVHLVYEHRGDIVGVIYISHYENLNLLFVHPTRQKAGFGKVLLDRALQLCRQEGKKCQLTLNSSNYAAPFYLKYGFTQNGNPINRPGGCIPMTINL